MQETLLKTQAAIKRNKTMACKSVPRIEVVQSISSARSDGSLSDSGSVASYANNAILPQKDKE